MIKIEINPNYKSLARDLLIMMGTDDLDDLHISPRKQVIAEKQRRFIKVTDRKLNNEDVFGLADAIYGSDTASALIIAGQKDIDTDVEVKFDEGDVLNKRVVRFRVNICSITKRGAIVPSISIRKMYEETPDWHVFRFEDLIWDNFRPENGIVWVTGPTGSGKSTLLAAGIGRILKERENEKIVTLEDPIEYTYDDIETDNIIEQSAIGVNTPDFEKPMKSILRRKPTIIIVGEARDRETIRACFYVSQTGHLVYTTTHTNGAPETLTRTLEEYPVSERESILANLINNTRMIVSQKILKTTDGKKVAIREVLPFTEEVRSFLKTATITNLHILAREAVDAYGISMADGAKKYYEMGLIYKEDYESITKQFGRGD